MATVVKIQMPADLDTTPEVENFYVSFHVSCKRLQTKTKLLLKNSCQITRLHSLWKFENVI